MFAAHMHFMVEIFKNKLAQVVEDPGGALRAHKERLRKEELIRTQQAQAVTNARALAKYCPFSYCSAGGSHIGLPIMQLPCP